MFVIPGLFSPFFFAYCFKSKVDIFRSLYCLSFHLIAISFNFEENKM